MASLATRIMQLEQRLTPAGACPELIILHGNEAMTPHQLAEIERAAKFSLPSLTLLIAGARHGNT